MPRVQKTGHLWTNAQHDLRPYSGRPHLLHHPLSSTKPPGLLVWAHFHRQSVLWEIGFLERLIQSGFENLLWIRKRTEERPGRDFSQPPEMRAHGTFKRSSWLRRVQFGTD